MATKILVSQPQPTSAKSPYYDIAQKHDVEIVFRPFIKVVGLSAREFRDQHINLAEFTAVVFNSRHAIDNFFALAKEMRVDISPDMKYFCITEQVALYIQKYVQYRKRKVFYGRTGKVEDLLPQMMKHRTDNYFVPLSDVHTDAIAKMMSSKKLRYTQGVMYRTVSNDFTPDEPFDYQVLVFFTPSGIASLLKNFPDFRDRYPDTVIGTFGAGTTAAAEEAGLRVAFQAPSPQFPSIAAALAHYLGQQA